MPEQYSPTPDTPVNPPAVQIGAWQLSPQRGGVLDPQGRLQRLQPRVLAVLQMLAQSPRRTVSREQLLSQVWQGRVVSDDAVTRCIYALRKLFADDPAIRLITVPKRGYRLEWPDKGPSSAAQQMRRGVPPRRRSDWAVSALVVGVTLAISASLIGLDRPPASGTGQWRQRPLTSLPGQEIQPALSPAGGQLVYAARAAADDHWQLYLQALDGQARPLTALPGDALHPRWSPDGGRIAFVYYPADPLETAAIGTVSDADHAACQLMSVASSGGTPRVLAHCGATRVQSLDWSPDGRGLIFSARQHDLDAARPFWLDYQRQPLALKPRPYPLPVPAGQAVEDLRFSPDGQQLAFSIGIALGVEDLYTYDLQQQQLQRISHDQLKIHGLDWSAGGSALIAASNRNGAFQLWRYPLAGDPSPQLITVGSEQTEAPEVAAGQRIVYAAVRSDSDILRQSWPGANDIADVVVSTRYEWDLQFSPDGHWMSYISDRSGAAELWIARADGSGPQQLTRFEGPYIQHARWSPDSQQLVFSAPVEGAFDLYRVNLASRQLHRITDHPANDFAPIWYRSGGDGAAENWIYFGSDRGGEWAIYRIRPQGGEAQRVAAGGRVAQIDSTGRQLYFVRADRDGLWRRAIDVDAVAERVVAEFAPVDWNNWQLSERGLYFVRRDRAGMPRLLVYDLVAGDERVLMGLPGLLYHSGLWVDDGEGVVYYSVERDAEVDLRLLEW